MIFWGSGVMPSDHEPQRPTEARSTPAPRYLHLDIFSFFPAGIDIPGQFNATQPPLDRMGLA